MGFFVRTSSRLPKNRFLFRRFDYSAIKNSTSLYGQYNDVRTRKISEIETTSDAQERQKSTIVRAGGIGYKFNPRQSLGLTRSPPLAVAIC